MAKPSLTKLKLTQKNPVKIITFNEQEIEVKQYISMNEKLNLITSVLNLAADENKFYNPGKVDMYFALKVIDYYTNLSITDKQKEDSVKLYDLFISSGFYTEVYNAIPKDEIEYVYVIMKETVEQIYKYNNSAYGILDSLQTDYNGLDMDIQKLMTGIANKEDIELVNEVVSKLG